MTIREEQVDIGTPTGEHAKSGVSSRRQREISCRFTLFGNFSNYRTCTAHGVHIAGQGYLVAVREIYHEFEDPGSVLAYDQAGADRGNALKLRKSRRV